MLKQKIKEKGGGKNDKAGWANVDSDSSIWQDCGRNKPLFRQMAWNGDALKENIRAESRAARKAVPRLGHFF